MLTESDMRRLAEAAVLRGNSRVTVAAVREPESDVARMTTAIVSVGQAVQGQVWQLAANLHWSSATGSGVDRLGLNLYSAERKAPAPARGNVLVGTPTASPAFDIPAGTRASGPAGVLVTTRSVPIPANLEPDDRIPVPMQSLQAGADQIYGKGAITGFTDQIAGAPTDMIVEQPIPFNPGADRESEGEFKRRAPQHWQGQVIGTARAMEVEAMKVPGVTSAKAIAAVGPNGRLVNAGEIVVTDPMTLALVSQSIAAASPVSGGPSYQERARTLADVVLRRLQRRGVAFGAHLRVTVADVVMLPLQIAIHYAVGADVEQTNLVARVLITNYCNLLPVGAPFVRADVHELLRNVIGLVPGGDEIVLPQQDVVPEPEQVLRTTLELITISEP